MKCQWDIFPNYARMTVLTMRTPYWFLYEGTPGGKLDMDSDYCVRPGGANGIKTLVSEKWDGDIQMENEQGEWLYFGDGNRVLYLINHHDGNCTDSYWPMNEEMTVFGFGRLGLKKFMEKVPAQFTIGLHDSSSHQEIIKVPSTHHTCQLNGISDRLRKNNMLLLIRGRAKLLLSRWPIGPD